MQIIGRYQAPCRFTTEEVFQVWLSVAVLMTSRGGLDVSEKQVWIFMVGGFRPQCKFNVR